MQVTRTAGTIMDSKCERVIKDYQKCLELAPKRGCMEKQAKVLECRGMIHCPKVARAHFLCMTGTAESPCVVQEAKCWLQCHRAFMSVGRGDKGQRNCDVERDTLIACLPELSSSNATVS